MTSPLMALPLARLTRGPRALLPLLGWSAVALVAAGLARSASDALLGVFGALALPLAAYAIVGAAVERASLGRAIAALTAFGASPARAALAVVGVAALVSAAAGAVLTPLVAAIAHASADPPMARDLATCAWVGALAGAAYAAYFALGAAFGRGGLGRPIALGLDFLVGTGSGVGAALTPRAHLRSLLGGGAVADLSQRASAVALGALLVAYAAFAALRSRRAPR